MRSYWWSRGLRGLSVLLFVMLVAACGGGGGGTGNDGADNYVTPLDITKEFEETRNAVGTIEDAGSYNIDTFVNAEVAQQQIAENSIPTVLEIKGSILVLDLTSWPQDWDIMKVVVVRMPDGQVEYKRILNRFELTDGRLAIGVLGASVLDVIESGNIDMEGELTSLVNKSAVQSKISTQANKSAVVTVIDYVNSQTLEIYKKTNVDLVNFNGNGMSAELGFPEISVTANPTVTFKLDIDKPYGFSDVIGGVADISVNIIGKSKDVLAEIDGIAKYGDGRGIISAGVNLDQANNIIDAILATKEVSEKIEAIVSALSDKRRVKLAFVSISGDINGLIELRAYASAVYNKEGEAPLAVVLIPITGPVPIFLKFDLAGIYSMKFDASIEATTSLSLVIPLEASVKIVNGEFEEFIKPGFAPVVTFEPPAIHGEGKFEATAGLKIGAGISLANILNATLNPQAEAVFTSTATAEASVGSGVCAELDWDLFGRVSTQLEAELDLKAYRIGKTWDTPLNFTVYKDEEPFGSYLFGDCTGGSVEAIWYKDNDGDGYGDLNNTIMATIQPSGYVIDKTDCNDAAMTIHPGASEVPDDGIDQDCNGMDATIISGGHEEALVAYYPFNGDALDHSGNNLNGRIVGSPDFSVTDRFGNQNGAISIDSSNEYVRVSANPLLNLQEYTVAAWVQRDSTSSQLGGVFSYGDNRIEHYGFRASHGQISHVNNYILGSELLGNYQSSGSGLGGTNWHHIAITFDSTKKAIWLDGVKINEVEFSVPIDYSIVEDAIIGNDTPGGDEPWYGKIDEVRVYNRALNPPEMLSLFNVNY